MGWVGDEGSGLCLLVAPREDRAAGDGWWSRQRRDSVCTGVDCTRQDRQEYRQDKTATGWRQRQSMLIEELVANTDRVRLAFIHGAGEMTVRCARYLAGEENDAGSSAKSRARV